MFCDPLSDTIEAARNAVSMERTAFAFCYATALSGKRYGHCAEQGREWVEAEPVRPSEEAALEHIPTSFVAGTLVETARGEVPIEELRSGDMVLGTGGRTQLVRRVGLIALSAPVLDEQPASRPIRICAGALGQDLPTQDLLLASGTTILVPGTGIGAQAGLLVNGRSIAREPGGSAAYYYQVERETSAPLIVQGVLADVASNEGPTLRVLRARSRLAQAAGLMPGALEASIDVCDRSVISGWVRDIGCPDFSVALELEVDGTSVACIVADQRREDLIEANKGACAFRVLFEPPLQSDRPHMICLRRVDDNAPVPPGDIMLDSAPDIQVVLAALDETQIPALRGFIGK